MMMSVPPLSHLVYSMACIYLAMVGLVGFTANAFVAFLYCKSKKVRYMGVTIIHGEGRCLG